MSTFWLCFLPIFVAMDAVGGLPVFITLTEGLDSRRIRSVILQSVVTAGIVALLFLLVGKAVFNLLGITPADFMIAGGVLLFLFSVNSLLTLGDEKLHVDPESLGAVPLGVPMIVGPAVLTTALILIDEHGLRATTAAVFVNILLTGLVLLCSEPINRLLGKTGAKTVSKLTALLLGAIAVMMVRKGMMIVLGVKPPAT